MYVYKNICVCVLCVYLISCNIESKHFESEKTLKTNVVLTSSFIEEYLKVWNKESSSNGQQCKKNSFFFGRDMMKDQVSLFQVWCFPYQSKFFLERLYKCIETICLYRKVPQSAFFFFVLGGLESIAS